MISAVQKIFSNALIVVSKYPPRWETSVLRPPNPRSFYFLETIITGIPFLDIGISTITKDISQWNRRPNSKVVYVKVYLLRRTIALLAHLPIMTTKCSPIIVKLFLLNKKSSTKMSNTKEFSSDSSITRESINGVSFWAMKSRECF